MLAAGTPSASARTQALQLVRAFLARTQATHPPRRYLWTDAYAVQLLWALGETEAAEQLVGQVHSVLGRHHPRDTQGRRGWLGGRTDEDARAHPTRCGLRIGKPYPERGPGEAYDRDLEWDRDGQYFHYLTRWMAALACTGHVGWAVELAEGVHGHFMRPQGTGMFWKVSVDLARPLVASQGQHDPLDGYVTYSLLAALGPAPTLKRQREELASLCEGTDWASDDPLCLGGLLVAVWHILQLQAHGHTDRAMTSLLEGLVEGAAEGVGVYARQGGVDRPAHRRLAFRQFGLSIGLEAARRAVRVAEGLGVSAHTQAGLKEIAGHYALREHIHGFWGVQAHRQGGTWLEHQDINEVMWAASLWPEGCLAWPGDPMP